MMMDKKALTKVQAIAIVIIIVIAAIAGGVYYQSTQKPAAPPEEKKIKIGLILPLTGGLAALGKECLTGYVLATEEINAAGGIKSLGGAKVELVIADSKSDPKVAASECERLIMREGLKVIMGSYGSTLAYTASEVAERNKVIYWESGGTADALTERGFKYFFRVVPKVKQYVEQTFKFLKEYYLPNVGLKPEETKIAIACENTLYGQTWANVTRILAKNAQMKIVLDEAYPSQSTDLSPLITKLKAASPDVVVFIPYVTDAILFFRQAEQLGFYAKCYITCGGTALEDFVKALGDKTEGIMVSSFWSYDTALPDVDKLNDMFVAKYGGKHAGIYTGVNYIGAMSLYRVLEAAGSMDPDKIIDAAMKMDIDPPGICGYGLKFDPIEHQNQKATVWVLQWQGGTLRTIYPPSYAKVKPIWEMPKWK
jgi:branched-chain amino acid transport system substrate-binding protein